jgi:prolyl oligopeptidase
MHKALAALALAACAPPAKPTTTVPAPAVAPEPPAEVGPAPAPPPEDPYLWLEEISSERALAWAREQNRKSLSELEATPGLTATRDRIRAILDSKDRTPFVTKRGAHYYNFWRDAASPRGVLRRTTLAEYRKASPRWELVLDVDALAKAESENWVYSRLNCLYPRFDRCLVFLSRGGSDATVVRELDTRARQLVADGFTVPEAKSQVSWKDRDTLYVGTDFGPGSLTKSGYPRQVREWKRGTPLAAAQLVFEGQETDVAVAATRVWDRGKPYDYVSRSITRYASELFLRGAAGELRKIEIPADAEATIWSDQLLVTLRSDWALPGRTWPKGAMLATPWAAFQAGARDFTALFEPAPNRSLASAALMKTAVVTNELEDVKSRLYVWSLTGGKWARAPLAAGAAAASALGTTSLRSVDGLGETDDYWLIHTDFLTPSTLSLGALGKRAEPLKRGPTLFDAKGLEISQHFAISKDGTRVPYFQVARSSLPLDGSAPTLLYGYGGFEVSLTPGYDPTTGAAWLERGGVYVVANIRGGGEYGPPWHQAALRHHRQRAYDDFIAVAEDLIQRKVTSPARLGSHGGSNGGLLVGVMLTQRPDLFGAIVSEVPLLDMKRYHTLLAGASWMEEYGDPERAEDWAALARYSPYHNVRAGTKYPRTLFTSSTRDDRVHPGHARKMVARMLEQGHDVLYYENLEGGHSGAANHEQAALLAALRYTFLAKQLGLK